MRRSTTIFKQLIFNIVVPALLALTFMAAYNYLQKKKILVEFNEEKNLIITDELVRLMKFGDETFEILSDNMTMRMEGLSKILVEDIFKDTRDIEDADLYEIRQQLGMDESAEDIYIINLSGLIVNTTFEKDRGLNLFKLGKEHENHIRSIFEKGEFMDERFAVENRTKRLRKFSYQPSLDGKYIIELGFYSSRAEDFFDFMSKNKDEMTATQKNIEDVEMFFITDGSPFSFNKEATIKKEHREIFLKAMEEENTQILDEYENGRWLHYQYAFMNRENTSLYQAAVIRIVSDRTEEKKLLQREFFRFIIVLGITLLIVTLLTYRKTKVITDPIKRLLKNVSRISDGHLDERAAVVGNNEITTLSKKFNLMIAQLEVLYNDLEKKVKERTAEVVKQKEEIEEHQRNITDSIKYAKRIQTAILPPDEFVNETLGENFILYIPKDIVSGDFYWLDKKDDLAMVAAVDCTGHGVPGAFMSIVGNSQLNFAINVKHAREASEILNELNYGVTHTLRDKAGHESVKDGMDLALCVINYKEMSLEYAGAFNPLYLIRNNEVLITKADKFPIGASPDGKLSSFTNHEIDLVKGDVIYLFSDGFADQFGGPNNKKFFSKRFRELLLQVHKLPMQKQKESLIKAYEGWKGDCEQVDDILVIGIRI